MSETTREDLERTIQQAREDMATWPEWMREAARLGAALPPDVRSVADEMNRLRELADSEGTRSVECLRRARRAERLLREVLDALPGLQAPNCLGMDLYQRIGAAVGPNVAGNRPASAGPVEWRG